MGEWVGVCASLSARRGLLMGEAAAGAEEGRPQSS